MTMARFLANHLGVRASGAYFDMLEIVTAVPKIKIFSQII